MATILYVPSGADAYGPNQGRASPAEKYQELLGIYREKLKARNEVRERKEKRWTEKCERGLYGWKTCGKEVVREQSLRPDSL